MIKPTIAIDIDDVLADTTEALRLVANKIDGVSLTVAQYRVEGEYWGYYEKVWSDNKVDHLVSFEKLHDDMAADQSHVPVVGGARAVISELAKNFRLVAMTSRRVQWVDATHSWVDKNFAGMFEDIVFVHHDNSDGRTKGDACVEVNAEWLVDDNIEHCQTALQKGLKVIVFGEYGWNKYAKTTKGMMRAKSWQQVLEYFDGKE